MGKQQNPEPEENDADISLTPAQAEAVKSLIDAVKKEETDTTIACHTFPHLGHGSCCHCHHCHCNHVHWQYPYYGYYGQATWINSTTSTSTTPTTYGTGTTTTNYGGSNVHYL